MSPFKSLKELLYYINVFILYNITGYRINSREKLLKVLEQVYLDDQKVRNVSDAERQKNLKFIDRVNLLKVEAIFKHHGWPSELTMEDGCHIALFLVVQHSNQKVRRKYLPILQRAAKNGKMKRSQLALLEDRLATEDGKPQIYGSQIGWDEHSQKYFIEPIENPKLVNERRREVGLPSLQDYVARWNIILDADNYN